MAKGTSLLEQNDELKKKWGGDTLKYDAQGALNRGEITQTDYANYLSDLKYINSIDSLNKAYTGAVDKAQQSESRAMQYADTRRQLMQKYLPETLMAQGIANTGYTADALLKAENNYNQYVMGAMGERAEAEQNALQAYQDALQGYKTQKAESDYGRFLDQQNADRQFMASAIDWIEAGYDMDYVRDQGKALGISDEVINGLQGSYDTKVEKGQTELYNTYLKNISQVTLADIEADLEAGNLTEPQADKLKAAKKNRVTEAYFNERGSKLKDEGGDNFSIVYDDKKYRVEVNGRAKSDGAVNYAKTNEVKDGQVFIYQGVLYIKKDGKVYIITGRNNDKSFRELKNALGL